MLEYQYFMRLFFLIDSFEFHISFSAAKVRVTFNAHFTGVYIPQRGCFSACFIAKAVVGLDRRTGRCKHPRLLCVLIKRE